MKKPYFFYNNYIPEVPEVYMPLYIIMQLFHAQIIAISVFSAKCRNCLYNLKFFI